MTIEWTKTETGYEALALGGKFTATRVPGRWFKLAFLPADGIKTPVEWTKRMSLTAAKDTADRYVAEVGKQSADPTPSVPTANVPSADESSASVASAPVTAGTNPRMTPGHPMAGMGPTDDEIARHEAGQSASDLPLATDRFQVDPPEPEKTDPDLDPDKIATPTYVPGHVPPGPDGDDDRDPELEPTPLEPPPAVPVQDPPGGEARFTPLLDTLCRLDVIRATAWSAGAHVRTVRKYVNPRSARRAG